MYERPEILEIGNAERLTLGRPNLACDDTCECTKDADVDVGLQVASSSSSC
jgi:hypothetical protein